MKLLEIRDPDEAQRHLLDGLRLTRARWLAEEDVRSILAWAGEILASGGPLPSLGIVADIGLRAASLHESGIWAAPLNGPGEPQNAADSPQLAAALGSCTSPVRHTSVDWRRYEDIVLGKLCVDRSFERACDAIARRRGADRDRAVAFVVHRICERAGVGGAAISPAVLRHLARTPWRRLVSQCESLPASDPSPQRAAEYSRMTASFRDLGPLLDAADLFELEHVAALSTFGDRLALRQTIMAVELLLQATPVRRPRVLAPKRTVETRLPTEDSYPVGGFSAISNRGSPESLLHSQLVYMDPGQRPDLFDAKYLRDELLYYSRDEGQFLRQRRTFVFLLSADLVQARIKDAQAPYQRIVLVLAWLLAARKRLEDWLGADSLRFEFLFLEEATNRRIEKRSLSAERSLLELILAEQIACNRARVASLPLESAGKLIEEQRLHSQTQVLLIGAERPALEKQAPAELTANRLCICGANPELMLDGQAPSPAEAEEGLEAWSKALERLLRSWL